MDFDLSDEQRQLKESVGRLLADNYGDLNQRIAYMKEPKGYSDKLWGQYAELGLLGIPFAWPGAAVLAAGAVAAVLFSTMLGLCGAIGPGWRLRRLEPYELIRTEAR